MLKDCEMSLTSLKHGSMAHTNMAQWLTCVAPMGKFMDEDALLCVAVAWVHQNIFLAH